MPPEPKNIKLFIRGVRSRVSKGNISGDNIDWDSLAVWYLNKLPSYLWKYWKNELEKEGYTWQKFLKVLKLHTNDVILWALNEEINWKELLIRIRDTIERYSSLKRTLINSPLRL